MKKIVIHIVFLLFAHSLCAVPIVGGTKIYLNTGGSSLWNQDNAWFVAYFYNDYVPGYVTMTPTIYSNIYVAEAPSTAWTDVIFVRMSPNCSAFSWGCAWNQTNDLNYDGIRNMYTIDGWGEIAPIKSTGTWSVAPFCSFPEFTVNVDTCDGSTYNLSGKASFSNAPLFGDLIVRDLLSGKTVQTSYPFTSPYEFRIEDIPVTTAEKQASLTISFSQGTCNSTVQYIKPRKEEIQACQNSTLTLETQFDGYEYLWNTGETNKAINVSIQKDTTYICSVTTISQEPVIEDNIMSNGGFEDISIPYYKGFSTDYEQFALNAPFDYNRSDRGWAVVSSNTKNQNVSLTEVIPHSGGYMLFIDGNTKRSSAWIAQTSQNNPNLKIEAGRTYRFSYWASGVGETNPAKLSFWIKYNGKEQQLGTTQTLIPIWKENIVFFTAPEDCDDITISVVDENISSNTSGNDFALDDILFQPISTGKQTLFEVFDINVLTQPKFSIPSEIHSCSDATTISIPFKIEEGSPNHYDLDFSSPLFTDIGDAALPQNDTIKIPLPTAAANLYTANLTVRNDETGCESSDSFTINVSAQPKVSIPSEIHSCSDATSISIPFKVEDGSPDHYDLDFSSPLFTDIENAALPQNDTIKIALPIREANLYSAKLTVKNEETGCESSDIFAINVSAQPKVSIPSEIHSCSDAMTISIPFKIEEGSPDYYDLDFSSPLFIDIKNALLPTDTISFAQPERAFAGLYSASLTVKNNETGCESSENVNFTIDKSMVYAKWDDVLFCDNLEQHFVAYQWYHNGEAIVGATNQYYYNPEGFSGSYYVVASTAKGTSYFSCVLDYEFVPKSKDSGRVYPVPVAQNEPITIVLPSSTKKAIGQLTIVNSLGQTISTETVNSNEIVKYMNAPQGIYLLDYSENGESLWTEKIIVH